MIAIDTNILVYAHRRDLPSHARAAAVVRQLAEGAAPWGIPWDCLAEFLAIVTNRTLWRDDATPVEIALGQVEAWLASPTVRLLGESTSFFVTLKEVVLDGGVSGAQVHDARVAAVCMHNGVTELLTADRDFGRFPRLNTRNPLVR